VAWDENQLGYVIDDFAAFVTIKMIVSSKSDFYDDFIRTIC